MTVGLVFVLTDKLRVTPFAVVPVTVEDWEVERDMIYAVAEAYAWFGEIPRLETTIAGCIGLWC